MGPSWTSPLRKQRKLMFGEEILLVFSSLCLKFPVFYPQTVNSTVSVIYISVPAELLSDCYVGVSLM